MKKLSIVVPAYNEEDTIIEILNKVNKVSLKKYKLSKEVIVVDDGSQDRTTELLEEENGELYDCLIKKENGGKGSAVRRGFQKAEGDLILIQDADLEYEPEDYPKLIKPIINNETEVVYGSRFIGKPFFSKERWAIPSHYIGNKLLSLLTSILFFKWITDMETCYKCFTKNALNSMSLEEKDFRIEPEMTTQLIKKGFKIKEVPISYSSRGFDEGKKIDWRDGIKAVISILKYRIKY